MIASWSTLALLGLGAGVITTVSGMGGGLVLLLSLTPLPRESWWRNAFFRYPLETMASWMQPRLPETVQERMNP